MLENLSTGQISALLSQLHNMTRAEKEALLTEIEQLDEKKRIKRCQDDFLAFCANMYPDWKEGPHHRFLNPIMSAVRDGDEAA